MSNIWFWGDPHLGHINVLKLSNRPFGDITHHNDTLIDNYNRLIKTDDICYIMGDISFNQSLKSYEQIFNRLNGKKWVIVGNHDSKKTLEICQKKGLILGWSENKIIDYKGKRIFLAHFPFREWTGFYRGYYHLYAHTHGNLEDYKQSTDVGVDCWDYEPVSIDEVLKYIDTECEKNVQTN